MRTASAVALALFLSIGLAACDFAGVNDAIDDFKLIIGLEKISTPVSVKFVDATSGELVSSEVELSFAGEDGSAVVDLFNDPIASGKGTYPGGVAAFGIANGLTPSTDDPVSLRLTARAPGYEPQVQYVRITQSGRQSYVVRMTAIGSAPQGGAATTVQKGTADASGSITEPIHVSTGPTGDGQSTASVSVPAGTVARTAGGTPLSGALTTSITYANGSSPKALATFPGGFGAEVEGGSNGVLTTVGFANVTVQDSRGNVAKTFTNPIEIGIDIAPGTINPVTGVEVTTGDELEVFSFDVEDGVWKREGRATVVTVDGRLRASYQADHLSTWSFGLYGTPCVTSFSIESNGNSVTGVRFWNSTYTHTFPVFTMGPGIYFGHAILPAGPVDYEILGSASITGTFSDCAVPNMSLPPAAQTVEVTIADAVKPCPAGQKLKAGYEGDYGVEVAEIVNGQPDWEAAQTVAVSVVTDDQEVRGSASVTVRAGSDYRVQGSFNEQEITGGFSVPADVTAGDVIMAQIDNQITDDVAAEACE